MSYTLLQRVHSFLWLHGLAPDDVGYLEVQCHIFSVQWSALLWHSRALDVIFQVPWAESVV